MSQDPAARSAARSHGFGTRAIAAASVPPEVRQTGTSVPIYQAAAFAADGADELAAILSFKTPGYSYARIENPTADALGRAYAEISGAEAGFAFGSGMGAIHAALTASLSAGDRVVCTRAVYGSTRHLLTEVLGRLGVETVFVDPTDLAAVASALAGGARVLYLETISNPTIVVADLPALAELGHRAGAMVIVDNTFASPYVCRPAELGADVVVESATKWLGGHSDVIAGVAAGSRAAIERIRAISIDTGGIIAPFSAFLVLRGIQTLHVRMEAHARTALALAEHLSGRPEVARVLYPGLASHPQAGVAARLLHTGGGMLAVDLGTRAAAASFIDALTIPPTTASLGSVHTLAVHPPSHTHRQLDDAGLAQAGIAQGLVRISVGLEDLADLLADVDVALEAARTAG
ncbi:MAG: aminotransferase class I/II-fold pyridoxal phosphate-dependent enzyme [Chloroflexota bacterium]